MALDRDVRVEGATLRCRTDGAGDQAPWIVFGNSLMTDLTVWDPQVEVLARRYRILRYDQRGHGLSTVARAPFDISHLGADLLELLDAFSIEHCTYVGLSMGVPTGLAAHAAHCARFDRLVVVDGMAKTAPGGAQSWEERIAFASAEGMECLAEATVQRWLRPGAARGMKGQELKEMIAATPLEGFIQAARALQAYDYLDEVARIRCPLLAVAGAEDGAMPDTMEKVFKAASTQPLVRIPGAGHIPNFEQPDSFNTVLLRFLSGDP